MVSFKFIIIMTMSISSSSSISQSSTSPSSRTRTIQHHNIYDFVCVSLANNLYTARLQQEGILIGQRCICHSRLCGFVIPRAGICHPDSLPSSFCPSVGGGLFCLYSGIFCPKGWLWGSGALQCHISTACTDRGIGLRICSTLVQIKPGNTMLVSR